MSHSNVEFPCVKLNPFRSTRHRHSLFLPVVIVSWVSLANSLFGQGSTLIVTNLEDGGAGSLRQAIAIAQSWDKITFAVRGTVTLTNGQLLIGKSLSLIGPGATNLAICGGGQNRVLKILPAVRLLVAGVTICDGHAADGAAGTSNNPSGGDGFGGGGIYNGGFLAMTDCILSNCVAGNGGRGYFTENLTTLAATNWMGGVGGQGGAIYNAGDLALASSLVISNASGAGGYAGGTRDYGAPGARGGGGGAVYSQGRVTLTGCIFDSNRAGDGGAGFIGYYNGFGTVPFDAGHQGGAGGDGGALCDVGDSGTAIVRCQFRFNASGAGGMGSGYGFMALVAHAGAGGPGGGGGAVWSQNSVWMNGCTFLANHTGPGGAGGVADTSSGMGGNGGIGGPGGAIFTKGELSMNYCFCTSNYAGMGGAGGRCVPGSGGSGANGGSGGAIYAAGPLRLNDCALSYNLAGAGGQGASASGSSTFYFSAAGEGGTGGAGGGVYCEAYLEANQCSVNENESGNAGSPGIPGFDLDLSGQNTTSGSDGGQGGGVFGAGAIVLNACTFSGNRGGNGSSAAPKSAALMVVDPGSEGATRTDSPPVSPRPKIIIYTLRGQPGGAGGCGGLYSANRLRMVLCTVSANVGGTGAFGGDSGGGYFEYIPGGAGGSGGPGGICCAGSNNVDLVACTFSGNRGGAGAAGGSGVTVPDSSGRNGQGSGGDGGAGGILKTDPAASAHLINTIVASNVGGAGGQGGPYPGSSGNAGAPDLQGSFTSLGHNLIGQTGGDSGFTNGVNGDLTGSAGAPLDPNLGSLADNGGLTPTFALLHGSPALHNGDDAVLGSPYFLATDQRGFPRKSGEHVDIGAFESQLGGPERPLPTLSAVLLRGDSNGEVGGSVPGVPRLQLAFSDSTPGATFTILATIDLSLPCDDWSVLGQALAIAPGLFQFTDFDATNAPQRFYRVSSP